MKTVDEIMEQAQVFASTWSLVGGRFDDGDLLNIANDAKAELREMVEAALNAQAAHVAELERQLAEAKKDSEQSGTALKAAKRLFDEALPKFNWGASFLDANAIQLLNSVPDQVARAIKAKEQPWT